MNKELTRIIDLYQTSVANLFPKLATHLGVRLPIKNRDWIGVGEAQRGITKCGIEYFMHGYGVEMKYRNVKVDFDLGDEGQIDGIDPWKLWYYLEDSNISTTYASAKQLENDIKEATKHGDLTYSGYQLYYLT